MVLDCNLYSVFRLCLCRLAAINLDGQQDHLLHRFLPPNVCLWRISEQKTSLKLAQVERLGSWLFTSPHICWCLLRVGGFRSGLRSVVFRGNAPSVTDYFHLWTVRRTNRWTGATGSDFRIKRRPAKLLDSAVARSTQPLTIAAI